MMETKREICAEPRGESLNVNVIKKILKLHKQDNDEGDE